MNEQDREQEKTPPKARFLGVDLETTGLDPHTHHPIEIALVALTAELAELGRWTSLIWQPQSVLGLMCPLVRGMHSVSDLLRESCEALDLGHVEQEAIAFLLKHFPGGEATLLGSTVGFDLSFLCKHTPGLASLCHYRSIDVSSFRLVFKEHWGLPTFVAHELNHPLPEHRALPDILRSIEELRFILARVSPTPLGVEL